MSLALDWDTVVYVAVRLEQIEEFGVNLLASTGAHERRSVANHNKGISCTRKQDVETLGRRHESDVVVRVASGKGDDDDFTLFTLVIV